jgi:hypothetical protein
MRTARSAVSIATEDTRGEKGGTGIVDDLFDVVPALAEEFGG